MLPQMAEAKKEYLPQSVQVRGSFTIPWKCGRLPPSKLRYLFTKITDADFGQIPQEQELSQTLPIMKPDLCQIKNPPSGGIQATWLGHATVLIQMEGLTFITDPIFSIRCSPVPFGGHVRYRNVPCAVSDLPTLDAVLISHNHYDHLDKSTACQLHAQFGNRLHWYVPLGLASWFTTQIGCENVKEMNWWEEDHFPNHPDVKFVFTPAQHWSGRGLLDTNQTLWGSWCIIGQSSKFFFAGDTGYCEVFKSVGEKYGPFDFSAIPIGAYEPRWFMNPQHVNPEEAVKIHQDIRSRKSLGIHWGTFKLSNEHYLAPREKLKDLVKKMGLHPSDFFTLKHGQTVFMESSSSQDDKDNAKL